MIEVKFASWTGSQKIEDAINKIDEDAISDLSDMFISIEKLLNQNLNVMIRKRGVDNYLVFVDDRLFNQR